MTQSRQITDPVNKFGTTLAQASLINEAPLRLKLRSVNLGVVDSLVPRLIYWRKRLACALRYQIKFLMLITAQDPRIKD